MERHQEINNLTKLGWEFQGVPREDREGKEWIEHQFKSPRMDSFATFIYGSGRTLLDFEASQLSFITYSKAKDQLEKRSRELLYQFFTVNLNAHPDDDFIIRPIIQTQTIA